MDENVRALLLAPNFAHIATVRANGSAAVTPIWVDWQDDHVLVNSTPRRAWVRNLERDPRVTLSVSALDNPYECATIRGHASTFTTDGAEEHFQQLFRQYRDRTIPATEDAADHGPQDLDRRLLIRIAVEAVQYQWQPGPGSTDEYDAFLAKIMTPPTVETST